jgi:hypothetical protein
MPDLDNGWKEWSRYVLKELERLNTSYESLRDDIVKIKQEIATLKVQAGIWGAIAGAMPVIAMILYKVISNGRF